MGHRVQGGERKGWNSSESHSLTVAQHPGIWGICLPCLGLIAHWPGLPVLGGPVGSPLIFSDLLLSHLTLGHLLDTSSVQR